LAFILVASASPAAAQDVGDEVVIRVGLHAEEKNLNPFIVPQAQPLTHDLTMLVYDSLFWSQSRLEPEPWLATGAEPSDDFRTWTVTLRDGVRWHDGEAFTADDVAFTFRYFDQHRGPGRYGHHVYQHPVFESATVIDDTTVELAFAQPIASFKLVPGGDLPILPQHIWEGIEDPRADATSLPVGTGPFRMIDYQRGSSYWFEANQDYFLGAPLVDRLLMSVIPDEERAYADLLAGELDFVTANIPVSLVEDVERADELETIGGTLNQSVYLMFNLNEPALQDQQVRKALSLALAVDVMLEVIEGGQGRLGTDTWTHPNSPWTRDPIGAHLSDAIAAAQLLDAAGYGTGEGGNRTGPDGEPLALTVGVNPAVPGHLQAAEMVADQLGELGVPVGIEELTSSDINAARGDGGEGPPPVDLLIDEMESHAHDDPDHLYFLFHSSAGGIGQTFGYANPELDAVLEQALGQTEDARLPLIHQAQDILAEDVPMIVLYYPAGRWGYRWAAYEAWTSDQGHGVFTKRSFLEQYAALDDETNSGLNRLADPGEQSGDSGGPGLLPIAGLVAAAITGFALIGFGVFRQRRGGEPAPDPGS
jgi:peptide/nickel transport system substrate-binding protein